MQIVTVHEHLYFCGPDLENQLPNRSNAAGSTPAQLRGKI
jgi:hypothetical protein